ncbi:MAG TPA: MBL fold metallo-hydrolase [Candidatus Dormibacteraeota bacterium]|jgi:glyoxylase-like metal-dependent hydrolase (beta-lactamase superfamily II)|nr:MBL fold metallo-hydrolase [Candidatus Dormibacteraeota bacterium]
MAENEFIDLHHLGRKRVNSVWVVEGDYLVDCGPSVTVDALLAALGDRRPRAIVLTHVHLDHGGAAGELVRRWPELEVWAPEGVIPHLIDPERLIASSRRVYGDRLETFCGIPLPVPQDRLRTIRDGETAGPFQVVDTPGHASSHVALLHRASGDAFCGDAAGVRIPPSTYVNAPTVPPEFDPDAWHRSVARIRELRPDRVIVTHGGAFTDVEVHLDRLDQELDDVVRVSAGGGREGFDAWLDRRFAEAGPPAVGETYEQACQRQIAWAGMERMLRKRAG